MTDALNTAKAGGKLVLLLVVALVVLVGVSGVLGWMADPFGWRKRELATARSEAAQGRADAAVSEGQAGIVQDGAAIADRGRLRDNVTINIEKGNRDAILSTPGPASRLDPELIRRARLGLCEYESTSSDPGCIVLRQGDSE